MTIHSYRSGRWVALAVVVLCLCCPHNSANAQIGEQDDSVEYRLRIAYLQAKLDQTVRLLEEERLIRTGAAMREQLQKADANGAAMAWSLNDAGLLMAKEGQLDVALPLFRRALQIIETHFDKMDPARGTLLQNLGDVQLLKQDPEAVDLYREAATVFEAVAGETHPRVASALNGWATALRSQGRPLESEALYRKAIQIYESWTRMADQDEVSMRGDRLSDSSPLDLVAPLHNLALLLLDDGRLQESQTLLADAYKVLKKHDMHKSIQAIPVLRALGRVQRAAGDDEKAASCDLIADRLELHQLDPTLGDI